MLAVRAVHLVDADGDGVVTKAEFIRWHHVKWRRAPTDLDMKKFYDADSNGDGSISSAEFEKCTKLRSRSAPCSRLANSSPGGRVIPEFSAPITISKANSRAKELRRTRSSRVEELEEAFGYSQVLDLTTWTILLHNGCNHLVL